MTAELPREHAPVVPREPVTLTSQDRSVYAALATTGVWWEAPGQWSSLRGVKAIDALNGLITNDVAALADGEMQYAAALSPKGKLVSDMIVVRRDETAVLVNVPDVAAAPWLTLARKYVNPRLAKIADESAQLRAFVVCGALEKVEHITANANAATSRLLLRGTIAALHAARLILVDTVDADLVRQQFAATNRQHASHRVVELLRIEAGQPLMGVDMDENTIPQEAGLDTLNAISFTKGCYTGQETVARVHFRGHVNRHLRGLVSAHTLRPGSIVIESGGKTVGDIRSSVESPTFGAIALGMIRREVAIGANVTVEGRDGPTTAQVVALPFVAASD